jgi:alpha-L-arabinofuranosidase
MTRGWSSKGAATGFDEEEWYLALRNATRIQELVSRHEAVMDRWDPQRKVGLVVDEWGAWWDVEPGTNPGFLYQQNTLRDALVASVHLDTFHRHAARVVMANIAQTVNVLQAMILTDPETGALVLTPTYHVFAMNRAHHDAASLAVTFRGEMPLREVAGANLATVSASVSTRGDTALVSLSNLDAQRGGGGILKRFTDGFVGKRYSAPRHSSMAPRHSGLDPRLTCSGLLHAADGADSARPPPGLSSVL